MSGEWNGAETGSADDTFGATSLQQLAGAGRRPRASDNGLLGALSSPPQRPRPRMTPLGRPPPRRRVPASTADIAPTPTGTASCMSCRRRTVHHEVLDAETASRADRQYSPSEVPGDSVDTATRLQHREGGEQNGEDGRLRVGGQLELLLRPLEAQP